MPYPIRGHIIVLAFGLLALSCKDGPTVPTQKDVEEIQYVVLKYQFSGAQFLKPNSGSWIYYISIAISDSMHFFQSDKDPSEDLLKRFSDHIPPVKKYSDGHYIDLGFYDKVSGERGIIYRVAQITWTSERTAQLDGGDYFGGLGADRFLFYVSRKNGSWSVDSTHWWGSS
jgi:hypothetical protein